MFFRKLGDGLYGTPHNEDEVERSSMKIRIVGRIVGAACSETIRNYIFVY